MKEIELETIASIDHAISYPTAKCYPMGGVAHAKACAIALMSGWEHCLALKKSIRAGTSQTMRIEQDQEG